MSHPGTLIASSRPPIGPGTGIPGQPSQPVPHPEPTDVPGESPEPEDPGQGQPIPPEMIAGAHDEARVLADNVRYARGVGRFDRE